MNRLSAEYNIDGSYFEIRGKIPSNLNLTDFLTRIISELSKKTNVSVHKRIKINKDPRQNDLFLETIPEHTLKRIPVLKGNRRRRKFSEENSDISLKKII